MHRNERGTILIATTVMVSLVLAFVLLVLAMVQTKTVEGAVHHASNQARLLADAGIERLIERLIEPINKICPGYAFPAQLSAAIDGQASLKAFVLQELKDSSGAARGEHESRVTAVTLSGDDVFIDVESHGYWPSKAALATRNDASHETILARLRTGVSPGKVFDYSYFVNHGGWFCGSAITSIGSARANGPFSFSSNPCIDPWPVYEGYDPCHTMIGTRVSEGGVYAGLDIIGTCRGLGQLAEYRHPEQGPAKMPNISDLSYYEGRINGSSTKGTIRLIRDPDKVFAAEPPPAVVDVVADGIYGDNVDEKRNLYLDGSGDSIIEVNGLVVVRGGLMLKGRVQGQGIIISGGNTYVAGGLTYRHGRPTAAPAYSVNPAHGAPSTRSTFSEKPSGKSHGQIETYVGGSFNGDFLALFSRGHIVLGDFRMASWEDAVMPWLLHDLNRNDEDCGEDGIHGTGDAGEDDSFWQVSRYTAADAANGYIPPGADVGDVIPGTGEDLDGDGQLDPRLTTREQWRAQFRLPDPFDATGWGGSRIPASLDGAMGSNFTAMDGVFYTNHAFAGKISGTGKVSFFGSVVSRNEAMIFSPALETIHDERLTGGAMWRHLRNARTFTPVVPGVVEGITIVGWQLVSAP